MWLLLVVNNNNIIIFNHLYPLSSEPSGESPNLGFSDHILCKMVVGERCLIKGLIPASA